MTPATAVSTRHKSHPSDRVDITDRDDIIDLLRDFYGRAFRDELLGPIFVTIARMDLNTHLPVICDFWQTVLFHAGSYRRNALAPHQHLHTRAALTPTHFARWLALWHNTIDDRHAGPKAELAKLQGTRMAGAMSRRITGTAELGGADDARGSVTARRSLRSWSQDPTPSVRPRSARLARS